MSFNQGSSSGNLVLISSQTASNSASLVFTSGISGYDVYFLRYYGVVIQTNAQLLLMKFSTDGGSTYSNTGYTFESSFAYTGNLGVGTSGAQAGVILGDNLSNGSTIPCSGQAQIYNLGNASLNKQVVIQETGNHNSVGVYSETAACNWGTSTVVNAIKIVVASGNIVSGTFKLYGVQN